MADFHTDWAEADRFIPVVVYGDGSLRRLTSGSSFVAALAVAQTEADEYRRTFHPETPPRPYVEPSTAALVTAHTRSDATTAPLCRHAIAVHPAQTPVRS